MNSRDYAVSQVNQIHPKSRRLFWIVSAILALSLSISLLPLPLAGLLIVSVGLFILTLIQPLVGIAIVLLTGPLGALEALKYGSPFLKSGQIILFFTIGAWLANGILHRRIQIPRSSLYFPLVMFIFVGVLSLLAADSLSLGIKEVVKWIELGLLMIIVTDLAISWRPIESPRLGSKLKHPGGSDKRWILFILLVAGVSQAVVGIWQFGLRGDGPDHFMILDRYFRAFGTFQQPNPYGGFMGMATTLALGATIGMFFALLGKLKHGHQPGLGDWLWAAFLFACAFTTGLALVMSWSRGAWVGFAAGVVALVLFIPKRRWVGAILVAGGVLVLIFLLWQDLVPMSVSSRLLSFGEELRVRDVRGVHVTEENFSVIERLAHWQSGLEMARENIWLGVGFGNYESAYGDFALLNWSNPLGHAHNYYLNILAEMGAIGLLTYLIFWGTVVVQSLRLLRLVDWPDRGIVLGLFAAWIALSVHQLFDKLYVNNLFLFMGVMLALQQIIALKYEHDNN